MGAASDSRRLCNLPTPPTSVAAPAVDDWRRIQGKLPKAMSTSDSRRPATRGVCREPVAPPVDRHRKHVKIFLLDIAKIHIKISPKLTLMAMNLFNGLEIIAIRCCKIANLTSFDQNSSQISDKSAENDAICTETSIDQLWSHQIQFNFNQSGWMEVKWPWEGSVADVLSLDPHSRSVICASDERRRPWSRDVADADTGGDVSRTVLTIDSMIIQIYGIHSYSLWLISIEFISIEFISIKFFILNWFDLFELIWFIFIHFHWILFIWFEFIWFDLIDWIHFDSIELIEFKLIWFHFIDWIHFDWIELNWLWLFFISFKLI